MGTPNIPVCITLSEWNNMSTEAQKTVIESRKDNLSKAGFNRQKNESIEWASWSWNPVTGCLHNCPYCYANDIANRFYPQKFEPALIPERLSSPYNVNVPAAAQKNIGSKNVFTVSMGDLFGKWVPSEWIEAVLDTVVANPQWNFLMLTKNPTRLREFTFSKNAWIGTTVDRQERVEQAENIFSQIQAGVKFVSCEPLWERLTFTQLHLFDWVIIGGASRSTQSKKFQPPREWVTHLETQAYKAKCKIYEKANLLKRIKEYPGNPE